MPWRRLPQVLTAMSAFPENVALTSVPFCGQIELDYLSRGFFNPLPTCQICHPQRERLHGVTKSTYSIPSRSVLRALDSAKIVWTSACGALSAVAQSRAHDYVGEDLIPSCSDNGCGHSRHVKAWH